MNDPKLKQTMIRIAEAYEGSRATWTIWSIRSANDARGANLPL